MKSVLLIIMFCIMSALAFSETNDQITEFGIEIYGYGDSGYLLDFDKTSETTYPLLGASGGVYFERGKQNHNLSFLMNLAFRLVYSTGYPNSSLTSFSSDWWVADLYLGGKLDRKNKYGPYLTTGILISYNGYAYSLLNPRIEMGWVFSDKRELNFFSPTIFSQYEVKEKNLKFGITARYRYNLYKGFSTKNLSEIAQERPDTGFMLQIINQLSLDNSYYFGELFYYSGLSASVEVYFNPRVSFHTDFSLKANTTALDQGNNKHLIIGLEPHIRYYSQYSDFFIGIGTPIDFYLAYGGDSLPKDQITHFDIILDLGWRYKFGKNDNIPLDIIIGNRMMGLISPYLKIQIGYLFGK